jgi:hypothetical protein
MQPARYETVDAASMRFRKKVGNLSALAAVKTIVADGVSQDEDTKSSSVDVRNGSEGSLKRARKILW